MTQLNPNAKDVYNATRSKSSTCVSFVKIGKIQIAFGIARKPPSKHLANFIYANMIDPILEPFSFRYRHPHAHTLSQRGYLLE